MSLCVSAVILTLYILTWVVGLLAIYSNELSDPNTNIIETFFAILYAFMGVFVVIVMTINSKVGPH